MAISSLFVLLLCIAWTIASPLHSSEVDPEAIYPPGFTDNEETTPSSLTTASSTPTIPITSSATTVVNLNVTDKLEFPDEIEARSHDGSLGLPDLDASGDNVTIFHTNFERPDNSTFYSHSSIGESASSSSSSSTSSSTKPVDGSSLKDDQIHSEHQGELPFKLDFSENVPVKPLTDEKRSEVDESRNASTFINQDIFPSGPVSLPAEPEDGKEETSFDGITSERPEGTKEKVASGLNSNDDGDNTVTLGTSTGANSALPLAPSRGVLEQEEDEKDPRPSILELHPTTSSSGATGINTIRFRANVESEWRPYVDNMASFLEGYSKEAQERNVHCDFERTARPGEEACRFDLVYLGPSCTKQNNFGYGLGKPCVLLSPAPVDEWIPAPYENDTTGVPDEIQRLMRIFNANFMFVMCEGEGESDRANIGPMAYLPPYQGFPSYFFPNKVGSSSSFLSSSNSDSPHYVVPLMAIEFLNPANGTLINVKCRAWAKNLADSARKATLRFSFQVN